MNKTVCKVLFILISSTLLAQDLHIGVFIHTPMINFDEEKNEAYGPGIEYALLIAEEMGYEAHIEILPFRRIFTFLKTGDIDMSLDVGKVDERAYYIYYPDKPFFVHNPAITVLSESPLNAIESLDDLRGMKIGYLQGAYKGSFFKDNTVFEFELVSGENWIEQNLAKLLFGRVDGVLDQNRFSYLYEAKKQNVEDRIKVLELPMDGVESYVVISRQSKYGEEILKAYNDVNNNGKVDAYEIVRRYLGQD